MKFKLFINPNSQEIVYATVHRKSDFSTQLTQFVLSSDNSNIIHESYTHLTQQTHRS
ncbi:hypothetical protein [Lactobacillus taiwanensis]|uniref:hypothetical protein n=1 Tax=Lactobacillus taiwanensis TaxID=508451 RepID=UPI0021C25CB6|nr:hypothetical protein [Lactobacillus taiwanensis]